MKKRLRRHREGGSTRLESASAGSSTPLQRPKKMPKFSWQNGTSRTGSGAWTAGRAKSGILHMSSTNRKKSQYALWSQHHCKWDGWSHRCIFALPRRRHGTSPRTTLKRASGHGHDTNSKSMQPGWRTILTSHRTWMVQAVSGTCWRYMLMTLSVLSSLRPRHNCTM
jgi:hypothetical protein